MKTEIFFAILADGVLTFPQEFLSPSAERGLPTIINNLLFTEISGWKKMVNGRNTSLKLSRPYRGLKLLTRRRNRLVGVTLIN